MASPKPFKLFVYGTLMNPSVFRAVIGKRLAFGASDAADPEAAYARDAVLDGYRKVSPNNTYLYAIPDPQEQIRGYLIGPLPGECMKALRKYEGRNYVKQTVIVSTASTTEMAFAFVGNLKQLEHSFGYGFHDPFKQEILLREKIQQVLVEAEREQLHTEDDISRLAIGELHGSTIRDLVRRHFDAGGVSDYVIRQAIKGSPLRDFSRIAADPAARALAKHYLTLVVRQVMFNQVEDRLRQDFRFELDQMDLGTHYYERTISSLAALRLLNASQGLLELLTGDALAELEFGKARLLDFVRWAVRAAQVLYSPHAGQREMALIRERMNRGHLPLGAELEFSNTGHRVIGDPTGQAARDRDYDGFFYFNDFALDVLTWKLGGHIDDHHEKFSARPRRGFFEVALGSLSIEANLSKPITDDPWLLNQIIHEARAFYPIAPHSVHISMQLRSQNRPVRDRALPLHVLKCLFALGCDPRRDAAGRPVLQRLASDEIVGRDPVPHMQFSQISRRRSADKDEWADAPKTVSRYVQQFKFLRLSPAVDYETLGMALKGLQIALTPGNFLTASQYKTSKKHRQLFEDIVAWGRAPEPINEGETDSFLGHIYDGLMMERRGKPAHTKAYIAWALSQLRTQIAAFNTFLASPAPAANPG